MTDKTAIWDSLSKTDPAHTKGFKRAGGFSGTAVKPQWVILRLTQEFGPVGVGWGMDEPSFQVVPGDNKEVLVFCTVRAWHGSPSNVMFGVGGDKVVTHIKANEQYNRPERWENDDESFKKAYTDALMNAFKFAGVASDVHMGRFDDNKYVQEMKAEFAKDAAPAQSKLGNRSDTGPGEVEGKDFWKCEGPGMSAHAAKAAKLDDVHEQMRSELDRIPTAEAWRTWADTNLEDIQKMPLSWRMILRSEAEEKGRFLGAIAD